MPVADCRPGYAGWLSSVHVVRHGSAFVLVGDIGCDDLHRILQPFGCSVREVMSLSPVLQLCRWVPFRRGRSCKKKAYPDSVFRKDILAGTPNISVLAVINVEFHPLS